jgi:mannose-6-phosphate isomerase-like protein (cupin superfamily)
MSFAYGKLRRVVTGHDAKGRAVVEINEVCENIVSRREGHRSCVAWTEPGTVFRIVEYQPGVAPRRHRTSTVDYAAVLSGEIDMELDDGVSVHLRQGDVLVQRGTIHNWVNRGSVPCVIAFVLVDAKPVLDVVG